MDPNALLTVVILSTIGLCSCQNVLQLDGPLNGAIGENVVFKLITPPSTPPTSITWEYENRQIILAIGNNQSPAAAYKDRILLNTNTASLELQKLSITDSGEYTLTIHTDEGESKGKTLLKVFERISGAEIKLSNEDLIAGRSSVNLTCNATQGSSITREWTKDGTPLSSSNTITISEDNATVSISPVQKDDKGEYKCKLSNPISTAEATVMLNVSYGPEKPHIEGKKVIEIGSPINLTCTAESNPPSTYKWTFKEKETSGASYIKEQSEYEDSGNYICSAFNNITGNTSTAVFELSVEERISGAEIKLSNEDLIAGRSSVNLTCNATQGSSITRKWTKDGTPLSSSNTITISEDNATVSISPVQKDDKGEYKCKLSNPISTAEATVMLNVSYGPEKPHIEGKKVIEIGSPIHLTCTAESNPQSTYKWTFKGKETSGASYIKEQSEYEDSGNYTCSASNSITGITSTAVFELFVEAVHHDTGLTTGAKVGIAVGVLAALIAGIGLALFLKKKGNLGAPKHHQAPDQRPNGSVELNYADISQFQKKDGQKVNVGSSAAAGPQSKQFSNKGFGLRATAGNRANTEDQSTEYAAVKPKGQASGPPYQAQDVTYAQVRK